ncbi:MAG: malonic semialdehyde reductase [Alphaproteobacteria bacterium]|nr:malonic semialdehyde reductase [Alphaproteobacteria bacterium]
MTTAPLPQSALDQLFSSARTHRRWLPRPVAPETLAALYRLAALAPTSANTNPGRIAFVVSAAAKERLRPCLSASNVEQTMAAPVTAIVAHDLGFAEYLPRLYPHTDAAAWFTVPRVVQQTAFRNGTLFGGYLILAARALGLDCGPMSGFDGAKVDAAFFPDGRWRSNFLINLGHGDAAGLGPRDPRLDFAEACRVL